MNKQNKEKKPNKKDLKEKAKELEIPGYGSMKVAELKIKISEAEKDLILESTIDSTGKYRVLSLFSGMGGMDVGFAEQVVVHRDSVQQDYIESEYTIPGFVNLKRLPFATVFQNDIFSTARLIARLNKWAHNYVLKDIRELLKNNYAFPPADVITGGFPCFVAGTQILTNNGYKPIETVTLEDTLFTHTGKFQRIINLQRKENASSFYNIDIKYHPHTIECTEEHPFYVRQKVRKWDNSIRNYIHTYTEPEWLPVSKLTTEHYTGMSVNCDSITPTFTIPIYENNEKITNTVITLDKKDQWFMLGYFLGDGWTQDDRKKDGRLRYIIRFAINNKDEEYVVKRLSSIFPITDKKASTGACKKFGCSSIVWYMILKLFGKYAHGKSIPEWVQSAPKEFIQEFLDGYRMADGCILSSASGIKNQYSYTTVSNNIAFGIQRLYLKLGKLCSITYYKRPETCVIQGRTCNQRSTYSMRVYLSPQRAVSSFIDNNYGWFKISSITQITAPLQTVYNFEVENDNIYCVENTIVHNCQPFSHAGKREGLDIDKGVLYQSYVELVKRVQPIVFVAENVNGLLTMPTNVINTIISDFAAVGYEVKYQLIKSEEHGIPQTRWRVIIMGIRLDKRPKLTDDWNVITENKRSCTLRPYFAHLAEPVDATDLAQKAYSLAAKLEKGQGQSEVNLDGYGPTMRAEHHGNIEYRRLNGGNTGETLPERRLTVREAALIQTFPPDCKLTESDKVTMMAYKPIGNAVPPLLGYIIARKVEQILAKCT